MSLPSEVVVWVVRVRILKDGDVDSHGAEDDESENGMSLPVKRSRVGWFRHRHS